jgi:Zn finger protein HypA/HybF involved in hydrogenase expression
MSVPENWQVEQVEPMTTIINGKLLFNQKLTKELTMGWRLVSKKMKNFVRRKENFICEACGKKVTGDGYTDHCPACLWGKHRMRKYRVIELVNVGG